MVIKIVLATIIFGFFSSGVLAKELEMQPIENFLVKEGKPSDASMQFVGLRCAALFSIMSQYGFDNNMKDIGEKFKVASESAIEMAASASHPFNEDFLLGQLKMMMEAYTERWLKAKALTGNFSDDTIISADLNTCTTLF